jgi:hypothetical protein
MSKSFNALKPGDIIYKINLSVPKIKECKITSEWFSIIPGYMRCSSDNEIIRIPNETFYYSTCLDLGLNYGAIYYTDKNLTKQIIEDALNNMKKLDSRFIKTLDTIYLIL